MKRAPFAACLSGFGLIIAGICLWSVPAALIVAGVGLVVAGLFVDWEKSG